MNARIAGICIFCFFAQSAFSAEIDQCEEMRIGSGKEYAQGFEKAAAIWSKAAAGMKPEALEEAISCLYAYGYAYRKSGQEENDSQALLAGAALDRKARIFLGELNKKDRARAQRLAERMTSQDRILHKK